MIHENLSIGFIGAGNMATALTKGLLTAGIVEPESIYVSDVDEARRKQFRKETAANILASNAAVVSKADVVVLAVKPQQIAAVLNEIGPLFEERHLVISIAAGVSTSYIEKFLRNGVRLVRAMPNTPMLVGAGAAAICGGNWACEDDLALASRIFGSSAAVVIVEEKQMDAVTALSGSGPAYFFYFTETMIKAGVALGLSAEAAKTLALRTAYGAGKMLAEVPEPPEELRRRVTSPGGTTEAAISSMIRAGVADSITKAIEAAAQRSKELGEKL